MAWPAGAARQPGGRRPSRSAAGPPGGSGTRTPGRRRRPSSRHRYATGNQGPAWPSWSLLASLPLAVGERAPGAIRLGAGLDESKTPPPYREFTRHRGLGISQDAGGGGPGLGLPLEGYPSPRPVIPRRVALQRRAPPFGRTDCRVVSIALARKPHLLTTRKRPLLRVLSGPPGGSACSPLA